MAKAKKEAKAIKSLAKAAKTSETSDGNTTKLNIFRDNLKKIIDPHTGVNIVDMNMAQNIVVKEGKVSLDFIPTSPFCPIVNYFVEEIKKAAKHAGFSDCEVHLKI